MSEERVDNIGLPVQTDHNICSFIFFDRMDNPRSNIQIITAHHRDRHIGGSSNHGSLLQIPFTLLLFLLRTVIIINHIQCNQCILLLGILYHQSQINQIFNRLRISDRNQDLLLIYLFTVKLGWLPSGGMTTLGTSGGAADVAVHMVMPVIVLAVSMAGTNIRYIRSAVLEILQQDYLRTARAKGIGHFLVINKHALRNALVPIVTVIGMEIPVLFGGSIIVEQVFSWPGLGLMTMSAITNRDYPVIMGVCLLSAIVVLLGNLLTDILYAVVDPTIKLQ